MNNYLILKIKTCLYCILFIILLQPAYAETQIFDYGGLESSSIDLSKPNWALKKEEYISILNITNVAYNEYVYSDNSSLIVFNGNILGYLTEYNLYFEPDDTIERIIAYGNDCNSMISCVAIVTNEFGMPDIILDPNCESETNYNSYYIWSCALWTSDETTIYCVTNNQELYFHPDWDDDDLWFDNMSNYVEIGIYPRSYMEELLNQIEQY